jgi:hypothetical protein
MIFNPVHTEWQLVARSISPAAIYWLGQRSEARVHHVFDRSCNLINREGAILSLVSTEIGPGPFAITVGKAGSLPRDFLGIWDGVNTFSRVRCSPDEIRIGSVAVDLSKAQIWDPKPAWEDILPETLARTRQILEDFLPFCSTASKTLKNGHVSASTTTLMAAWRDLSAGLQANDIEQAKVGAKKMAGLGSGLTPAGDDFLMGFIYSLWSQWDPKEAQDWAKELVKEAAPRTTHLSVAWLMAAANGQAAEPWHRLVHALNQENSRDLVQAAAGIQATGHSSGADALAGYVAGLKALASLHSS